MVVYANKVIRVLFQLYAELYEKEGFSSKLNTIRSKVKPYKALRRDSTTKQKGKTKTQTNCNHDIKYFKCLGNGHITS
jgi:hypothetical protein